MRIVDIVKSGQQLNEEFAIKVYFECDDQSRVEACLLNLKNRGAIICISNQVGCSQRCLFCAAGLSEFIRNLTVNEITMQVSQIVERFPCLFSEKFEVTFMGSGEPLSNYENVKKAVKYLKDNFVNLRKINISTMLPNLNRNMISDFEQYRGELHFQYSLHFVNDTQRAKYFGLQLPSIQDSLSFLELLANAIDDQYAVNYILFDGINDTEQDIAKLVKLLSEKRGYLKISEMSSVNKSSLKKSKNITRIVEILKKTNLKHKIFESLGQDVSAGCGQFYNGSIV